MYTHTTNHQSTRLERFATTIAKAAALSACALTFVGCGDLAGLLGNTETVTCSLTGTVVGADGEIPTRIDIQWVPQAELSQSFELITSTTNEDGSFSITELVIEAESNRILGELRFGENVIPPNPIRYDQAIVPLDIPVSSCAQDLGEVVLPLQGTGTSNGTSNGTTGGTNNGTTDGTTAGTTGTGG
ncbi:MAG: hypothetical protein AAFX99_24715 [Myxococcota bacterium]